VCDDITNNARDEIITAIGGIDSWASSKITDEDEDEMQREVNIVRRDEAHETVKLTTGTVRCRVVA